jgi:hypothetical protein
MLDRVETVVEFDRRLITPDACTRRLHVRHEDVYAHFAEQGGRAADVARGDTSGGRLPAHVHWKGTESVVAQSYCQYCVVRV